MAKNVQQICDTSIYELKLLTSDKKTATAKSVLIIADFFFVGEKSDREGTFVERIFVTFLIA